MEKMDMKNKLTNIKFHHIGIPVDKSKLSNKARYSEIFKMYSEEVKNPLGIKTEYHAFDSNSPLDILIQTQIHIAFKINDIEKKLIGQKIIMPLYEPFSGYRCTIIQINNTLIELIETSLSEKELWDDEETLKNGILYANLNN